MTRNLIEEGRSALAACDWTTAASLFEEALEVEESPEVLDGLGQALYWLGDYPRALELRERAYAAHHRRGEHREAALVAVRLAMLHGLIYGNGAALSGWLGHAQRMLGHCEDCPERGWVELFRACITSDAREREERARDAMEAGRRFGEPGLEFDALAYLGKATVEQGAIEEGMGLIDEAVAAVTSGLVTDPWAAGEIYCTLFHACELAVDVPRAEGWLDAVDHYVERTGELPISAICRMHYGGVLTAAGRWEEAERELATALDIYRTTYRGTRSEALLRLAGLRVRQGRLEEAEHLLAGHEEAPHAAPALARLHLARGRAALARTVLERHLVRRGRGVLSAPALALLVEVELARGDPEAAAEVADELAELARTTDRASLRGFASLAAARVGAGPTRGLLEQARERFAAAALPHELATTRLELARTLAPTEPEVAREEARGALAGFQALGADRDADAAAALLRELGERGRTWVRGFGTLTAREREVLDLLAEGLTNVEIGERLVISPRTAEHHVGNILSKLGLDNRAAAAAYAVRRPG